MLLPGITLPARDGEVGCRLSGAKRDQKVSVRLKITKVDAVTGTVLVRVVVGVDRVNNCSGFF